MPPSSAHQQLPRHPLLYPPSECPRPSQLRIALPIEDLWTQMLPLPLPALSPRRARRPRGRTDDRRWGFLPGPGACPGGVRTVGGRWGDGGWPLRTRGWPPVRKGEGGGADFRQGPRNVDLVGAPTGQAMVRGPHGMRGLSTRVLVIHRYAPPPFSPSSNPKVWGVARPLSTDHHGMSRDNIGGK